MFTIFVVILSLVAGPILSKLAMLMLSDYLDCVRPLIGAPIGKNDLREESVLFIYACLGAINSIALSVAALHLATPIHWIWPVAAALLGGLMLPLILAIGISAIGVIAFLTKSILPIKATWKQVDRFYAEAKELAMRAFESDVVPYTFSVGVLVFGLSVAFWFFVVL